MESEGLLEERKAEESNLRDRIEYEIRSADLDIHSAAEQVRVAQQARDLSQQQLTQAQDRFAAGVANGLEVTQAQEAVVTADENYISSLYALNRGRGFTGSSYGNGRENNQVVFRRKVMASLFRAKWLLIPAVLILIVGGYAAWEYLSKWETTDDAQVDGHIHPINAKVGGTVTTVNVKENQRVEAGTVIAQIDPRDYEIAVARAEAELARRRPRAQARGPAFRSRRAPRDRRSLHPKRLPNVQKAASKWPAKNSRPRRRA